MEISGAYTTERAAALSGVPKSTAYYWARKGYLVPSVSVKPLLWSYTDLLALRTIYWLRQPKSAFERDVPSTSTPKVRRALKQLRDLDLGPFVEGRPTIALLARHPLPLSIEERDVPPTPMTKVRRALRQLRDLDLDLFAEGRPTLAVTLAGEIVIDADAMPLQLVDGQYLERSLVDILGPFEGLEGTKGPDLLWPRPTVQILPGKISGAPHISGTRVPTQSIYALADRGFSLDQLAKVYPFVSRDSLAESIDLEKQLQRNAALTRAA